MLPSPYECNVSYHEQGVHMQEEAEERRGTGRRHGISPTAPAGKVSKIQESVARAHHPLGCQGLAGHWDQV